ncbi:MAG: TetR/AcrR family transcriptional regulator [Planctomycetota bacterium]|nr:MAG: TetR/AcrR family transcriptional regulator [Planctomycetota bacterium]
MQPDAPNPPRLPPTRPGPAGGKRDRNRRQRTRALLEAGRQVLLERGIERSSVEAVARRAGMAKAGFYRYFRDLAELVRALFEPVATATLDAFERAARALDAARDTASVTAAYLQLGLELAAIFERDAALVQLYLQERRCPPTPARTPLLALSDRITTAAVELSRRAMDHGLLRRDNPEVTARVVIGAVERLLEAHFRDEPIGPPTEATRSLVRLVLEGLGAGPDRRPD